MSDFRMFSLDGDSPQTKLRAAGAMCRAHPQRIEVSRHIGLEILCRFSHTRHSRILDLCDSQSATGAFAKGRSSSFTLNRLMRKRAALEIAADVSVIVAWVCSADQPADKLSRFRQVKGLIKGARQHRKQCRASKADHPLDRGSI